MLEMIYKMFTKNYIYNIDNSDIYNYNKQVKERINKIIIIAGTIINSLLIAGIISLL